MKRPPADDDDLDFTCSARMRKARAIMRKARMRPPPSMPTS
jgi:hypothetical protein